MSDHDRICVKLDKLQTYYTELKALSSISLDEYINNSIAIFFRYKPLIYQNQ
jgi:hypothetical protein